MLDFNGINVWAVIVTWLISVIIGAWWYSPAGFGKKWTKLTGVDHMKMPVKQANRTIMFIALAALVQVLVLAVVINSVDARTAQEGLVVGFVLWVCLAASTVGHTLYSQLSWRLLWLNSSYFLFVMLINAVLFAVWR